MGAAMTDAGIHDRDEIVAVFAMASDLIQETGAAIYEPTLAFELSRLAREPADRVAARSA